MRRVETYVGQQVYEWLFSSQAQLTMVGLSKLSAAMLGTSGTVNGLPCTPTSPATMTVQIGAGEIYQMADLEATACGTLPANTTNTILKQGIQLGTSTTSAFAAPTTSGQSINYLIEVQYQDSDISLDPTTGNSPIVELFYNSVNPQAPWSGPNDSGATSNTFRDGIVAYQIKAGASATTGSQVTPTPDAGWIGLWVVSVPFGATTLTSSNIAQYTGAPVLPNGLLQSIINGNLTYGIDGGTANTVQAKFPIPVTALVDGMDVWVKIAAANTGTTTFTPNPGVIAAAPVVGAAHNALQGGETVAGGRANFVYRADITSWVMVECTGGADQIAPATASQHAVQLQQIGGGQYLGTQTISASGTYTPGVYTNGGRSVTASKAHFRGVAPGGGSGGCIATSSGQVAGSGPGNAGNPFDFWVVSGLAAMSITFGAAGAAGAAGANSGGTGGSIVIGAIATIHGGLGGQGGNATGTYPSLFNGNGGINTANSIASSGGMTVAGVISGIGQQGNRGIALSSSSILYSQGGTSQWGCGGTVDSAQSFGYGAGGGGNGIGANVAADAGFSGAPGILVIDEYA